MVDRIFNALVQKMTEILHRLTPHGDSPLTSLRLLQVDDDSPDAHTTQISDRVALFIQSKGAKLHHLPLKNCTVLGQERMNRFSLQVKLLCHTTLHLTVLM